MRNLLFFSHIPKTGGQTLLQMFYDAFGFEQCLRVWDPNHGAHVSPDDFHTLREEEFAGKKAVVGHLPLAKFLLNASMRDLDEKGVVTVVSVVRDPIDRCISLYNYLASNEKHPSHERFKNANPITFILNCPSNHQYNFLNANCASRRIWVAQTETSREFMQKRLLETGGRNVPISDIRNVTSDLAKNTPLFGRGDIPRDVMGRLKDRHSTDMMLYDLAGATNDTPADLSTLHRA